MLCTSGNAGKSVAGSVLGADRPSAGLGCANSSRLDVNEKVRGTVHLQWGTITRSNCGGDSIEFSPNEYSGLRSGLVLGGGEINRIAPITDDSGGEIASLNNGHSAGDGDGPNT